MPDNFFETQSQNSKIKAQIVYKYFTAWAGIIGRHAPKLGYLDFFSGQGKFDDESDSTPILIIKYALNNIQLTNSLATFFNDKNKKTIAKLQEHIKSLPNVTSLKFAPLFRNLKVEDIANELEFAKLNPTLVFIDPYGYKGLSLNIIGNAIKDWGCDCIIFFNYNRINTAITNPLIVSPIDSLFGRETANKLRDEVIGLNPQEREDHVMNVFLTALKKVNGLHSIKFKFYQKDKEKTSHFLILVTKNVAGYKVMKEIMAAFSDKFKDVPTYEYNPHRRSEWIATSLFEKEYDPIEDLAESLRKTFKGKTLTREQIFAKDNVGKPYIASNYKDALLRLEDQGKINANPQRNIRRVIKGKVTMAEDVQITFK